MENEEREKIKNICKTIHNYIEKEQNKKRINNSNNTNTNFDDFVDFDELTYFSDVENNNDDEFEKITISYDCSASLENLEKICHSIDGMDPLIYFLSK